MKEFMMIIGNKIIDNDWMELTLIPLTIAKQKKPLLNFDNLDDLICQVQGSKQHETVIFMRIEIWRDMKLKIGSHISMEVLVDE